MGRAGTTPFSLFPKMATPTRLEPPRAAWGHPIREAEPLWAASRIIGLAGPGNGLADQLSAQSRAGGNTSLVEGEDRYTVLGTRSWWHLQLRPVKFAEVSFVEQCLDRTAS